MDQDLELRPAQLYPFTISLPDVPSEEGAAPNGGNEVSSKLISITTRTLAELTVIARAVGSDLKMSVGLGKPGGGSFFNIERCSITLDPLHVAENPEFAKFVAGHEGSHRAITMGPVASGMPREEAELLMKQLGFHAGFNGCEDNAVNTWMVKKFPGLERIAKVVAFGLGPETDNVVQAYPKGFPNLRMRVSRDERANGIRPFAEVLSSVAEDMVKNPEHF